MIDWNNAVKVNGFSSCKKMLQHMYWTEGLSSREVSYRLGINRKSILDHLRKLGIPVKSRGGSNNHKCRKILKSLKGLMSEM